MHDNGFRLISNWLAISPREKGVLGHTEAIFHFCLLLGTSDEVFSWRKPRTKSVTCLIPVLLSQATVIVCIYKPENTWRGCWWWNMCNYFAQCNKSLQLFSWSGAQNSSLKMSVLCYPFPLTLAFFSLAVKLLLPLFSFSLFVSSLLVTWYSSCLDLSQG